MVDVTITRELGPARGRYVGTVAGFDGEAELTFVRLDAHFSGQESGDSDRCGGLAGELRAAVEEAHSGRDLVL